MGTIVHVAKGFTTRIGYVVNLEGDDAVDVRDNVFALSLTAEF